jgi:competence protein ComEC
MAKQKAKYKIGKPLTALFITALCAALVLTLSSHGYLPFDAPTWDDILPGELSYSAGEGVAQVHFIDCGQGDSILITQGDTAVMIDAAQSYLSDNVTEYLDSIGVDKVDAMILTHPDSDHIGGAAEIIERYDVDKVYMKKPLKGNEPVTKTYENLLDTLIENNLKITDPEVGTIIPAGDIYLEILGPSEMTDDNNNNSIVAKGIFGKTSFLFTGDAEEAEEHDLLAENKSALDCDVLKVGHHGSSSSSTSEFLNAVSPDVAVISCGEDNSYGHPHGETLRRLEAAGADIYRTDQDGTVVVTTDGENIKVQ